MEYKYVEIRFLALIGFNIHQKTSIIISILLCIGIYSCIESHDHDSFTLIYDQGGATDLRILSFNILTTIDVKAITEGYKKWVDRRDALFNYINNLSPDIIALQEASPSQYDQIDEYFSDSYKIIDNRGFSPDSILLYKRDIFNQLEKGHWILEKPDEPKIRRLAVWVKLEHKTTNKQLMAIGVHLDAKDIKLEEAKRLAGKIQENFRFNAPIILLGDFNAESDSSTYGQFINIGMKDWLTNEESQEHFTYPYHEPARRIDHIFLFSPRFTFKDHLHQLTPDEHISDHKPVALDITIEKS